ncbi:MAG: hypothetical protein RLZZ164_111 [Actinomycetota bacterium]|jgi:hypothetical protein
MSDQTNKGKQTPTPSRKAQEAANRKPLVGDKTKEGRKVSREHQAEERRKAREGMLRGEDKYLPVRDRGPQKRMARDIVDSRFTLGELVLPSMLVMLLAMGVTGQGKTISALGFWLQVGILAYMWLLFIAVGINAFMIGRKVSKLVGAKYGQTNVERGIGWYSAMRSIQLRPMRMPKPLVKRGHKF